MLHYVSYIRSGQVKIDDAVVKDTFRVRVSVFNATFNNISV